MRAAATLPILLLGACSTGNLLGGGSQTQNASSSQSFGQQISSLFGGTSQDVATATPGGPPQTDYECPGIDVRQGASTYSVTGAGAADAGALALRYQGTLGQTARECAFLGATMTIKVGIQGRIILGPMGAPGPVEVPLRLALVREGPEPKTVWTKFYRVPVTIEPGQSNTPFTYVEPDLTIPMPSADELDQYVIYVGFDPMGLTQQPARRPRR